MHVCPPFDFSMVLSCNVTILLRPTLFFKYFMYFSLTSKKIILNAKGSESLRTHYFFT